MVVRAGLADAVAMSLARKLLLAMFLVSLTGSAFGAGTFASFNATTTNANSTFATGSLVLSDKVASGTVCLSTGGTASVDAQFSNGNSNSGCAAVFTLGDVAQVPGAVSTVAVTLRNEGNVTGATGITGKGLTCSSVDTLAPNVFNGATSTYYHGTGDPCTYLQIRVLETDSSGSSITRCLYDSRGVNQSTPCSSGGTISNFVSASTTTAMTFASASVGARNTSTDSRYVKVELYFPNGAAGNENQYMGKGTTFGLQWTLTQ